MPGGSTYPLGSKGCCGGYDTDLIGYSADVIEKMERLCDLLTAIGDSDFVSGRLSFYGGTAPNFLHP